MFLYSSYYLAIGVTESENYFGLLDGLEKNASFRIFSVYWLHLSFVHEHIISL